MQDNRTADHGNTTREPWDDGRLHQVYLAFDRDGRLLYVGISWSAPHRIAQHRTAAPWWPEVARVEFHDCSDRHDAEHLEKSLIRAHAPAHNKQHNDRPETEAAVCPECHDVMYWEQIPDMVTERAGWLFLGRWVCFHCLDDWDAGVLVTEPPERARLIEAWPGWTSVDAIAQTVDDFNRGVR